MRRLFVVLAVLLAASTAGHAELGFKLISATTTSQVYFFNTPRYSVMLCNYGSDKIYYRLFVVGETPGGTAAAATNANALLVAGSATAPICVSFDRQQSQPQAWGAVSILADSTTATVHVLSE